MSSPTYGGSPAYARFAFPMLLLSTLLAGGSTAQASAPKLPNFIIVFCDDMGYADIGPFGAKGYNTPNLDRMAAEGMRFTDFYVGRSFCTPSRTALMTGCIPTRVGIGFWRHRQLLCHRSSTRGASNKCTILPRPTSAPLDPARHPQYIGLGSAIVPHCNGDQVGQPRPIPGPNPPTRQPGSTIRTTDSGSPFLTRKNSS